MAAASRAAQRDSERRYKQALKAQIAADAADVVAEWEAIMSDLVSIHARRSEHIDWHEVATRESPVLPTRESVNELVARARLDDFRPRGFDFLWGGSNKRRLRLENALAEARYQDELIFQKIEEQHQTELADWKADKDLAPRLLRREAAAIRDVIDEMQSLSGEGLLGTQIRFNINDGEVHAIVSVHSDEIVPKNRYKQLASGRLSETRMPAGEFNELYQDYICSAALRVGAELLGLLPLDEVYVTCTPLMLDTASGHLRETPVLSIQVVRGTLDRMRLEAIDPSDALANFNHSISFKRTKGFAPIKPLRTIDQ